MPNNALLFIPLLWSGGKMKEGRSQLRFGSRCTGTRFKRIFLRFLWAQEKYSIKVALYHAQTSFILKKKAKTTLI